MSVDVISEDTRWEKLGLQALADRAVAATLVHLGLDPNAYDVALLAADDARIAALNADFRARPQPTNVLSWPSEDRAADQDGAHPAKATTPELGDIALAYETCQAEAKEQKKPLDQHILHLIVHGVLHLLGYDHMREKDGDLMESQEIAILRVLGVPNPYE